MVNCDSFCSPLFSALLAAFQDRHGIHGVLCARFLPSFFDHFWIFDLLFSPLPPVAVRATLDEAYEIFFFDAFPWLAQGAIYFGFKDGTWLTPASKWDGGIGWLAWFVCRAKSSQLVSTMSTAFVLLPGLPGHSSSSRPKHHDTPPRYGGRLYEAA